MAKETLFAHVSITDINDIPIRNYAFDVNEISLEEFMMAEETALKNCYHKKYQVYKVFFSNYLLRMIIVGSN